jgi:hypothetical protein
VNIVGFLDDTPELQGIHLVKGVPVLGTISTLPDMERASWDAESSVLPGGQQCRKGEISTRRNLTRIRGAQFHFILKQMSLPRCTLIGDHGVYILPGTTIMPWCNLHNFVMMSVNSIVSHHSTLEEGTFLSFGVNFGAKIVAHRYSYLGIGSTIMSGVTELGMNCLIGAGAVVIKNVPDNAVMAGVPAKILRYK